VARDDNRSHIVAISHVRRTCNPGSHIDYVFAASVTWISHSPGLEGILLETRLSGQSGHPAEQLSRYPDIKLSGPHNPSHQEIRPRGSQSTQPNSIVDTRTSSCPGHTTLLIRKSDWRGSCMQFSPGHGGHGLPTDDAMNNMSGIFPMSIVPDIFILSLSREFPPPHAFLLAPAPPGQIRNWYRRTRG